MPLWRDAEVVFSHKGVGMGIRSLNDTVAGHSELDFRREDRRAMATRKECAPRIRNGLRGIDGESSVAAPFGQ